MIQNDFYNIGEYAAAGAFEAPERSLFYRKALGLRRYYEHCRLPEYDGRPLYPSGARVRDMRVAPDYMFGLGVNAAGANDEVRALLNRYGADFGQYHSVVPAEHTVAGNMSCHSIPHYGRIVREGFESYLVRIRHIADPEIRAGLTELVEGIRAYAARCAAYLESVCADRALIDALKKVPMRPAESFYEAVVAWNFVMYLDCCDNLGCVASDLIDFYHGEDVIPLLENLFDNLDANDGYSMALGTDTNALTIPCLRASKGKRRPMTELFVDEHTPDEVWAAAFDGIRSQNGQPAFYNPQLLRGLSERFPCIRPADITKFCGGGCTESMIAGMSNVGSLDAGINLLLILTQTMARDLAGAPDFESFYQCYIESVRAVVDNVTDKISHSQEIRARLNPLPMRTLLVDDCIDHGLDFNNGGARYKWSIINFAGLINVIDGLLVIRDRVFGAQDIDAAEMLHRLHENDPDFLAECRAHPAVFGTDDPDVNAFTRRISADIFSTVACRRPYIGEGFLAASIQFHCQADAGRHIGATPDGRAAGAPVCDSLGAIFGKDVCGPTALLKSVAAIDQGKMLGVPVLNFNINADFRDDILKALILSYMKMGGIQIQITCASAALLQEAYAHPELHKNLVVRVGGYSEYFYRLSDEMKRMILNRTIQKGV